MFITAKTIKKLNWNTTINLKEVVVHVLQTTQNLVISRCCFAEDGSYVVSPDTYWFETIYSKSLHKRTNQRSNDYMRRGDHR